YFFVPSGQASRLPAARAASRARSNGLPRRASHREVKIKLLTAGAKANRAIGSRPVQCKAAEPDVVPEPQSEQAAESRRPVVVPARSHSTKNTPADHRDQLLRVLPSDTTDRP